MRKTKAIALISLLVAAISLVGCSNAKETGVQEQTFAKWTEEEIFHKVPLLETEKSRIGEAVDYGGGNYVLNVDGTEFKDYKEYLSRLEDAGFKKYADNGEEGIEDSVYTTTYTKETLAVTVTHLTAMNKTYISASEELELSEHLIYQEKYKDGIKEGAKTTLSMMQLTDNGSSFLIQLKNGHFIMNDGGFYWNMASLFNYMETLVPEGEKPVIEAWFISHSHDDHAGWTKRTNADDFERVYVEAVYYNSPSDRVATATDAQDRVKAILRGVKLLRTTEGKAPNLYRPQTGQRYYFCDVTVDVLLTQEQVPLAETCGLGYPDEGPTDENVVSTWLMYTIEGQKFLFNADTEIDQMVLANHIYGEDYFNVDIMSVPHHGHNVYGGFAGFNSAKTLLYTNPTSEDETWGNLAMEANLEWQKEAVEFMTYGDGTKVLTFPYEIGSAQTIQTLNSNQEEE